MRATIRALSYLTAGVIVSSCGLVKNESETKEGATVSVESDGLSLSLPHIPKQEGDHYKARLQIVRGSMTTSHLNKMVCQLVKPIAHEPVEAINAFELRSVVRTPGERETDGITPPVVVSEKSIFAYDKLVEYRAGTSIGPIKLDDGTYTALLRIHKLEESKDSYHGLATFKITAGEAASIDMEMISGSLCVTKGAVTISPKIEEKHVSSGKRQLHMIGIYESAQNRRFRGHPMGDTEVRVRGNGPVILSLKSYEPTSWIIKADDDVVVERVIVSGYHKSKVTGVVNDKVEVSCYKECPNQDKYQYFYRHPSSNSQKVIDSVFAKTKMKPTSIQSQYSATKFEIKLK